MNNRGKNKKGIFFSADALIAISIIIITIIVLYPVVKSSVNRSEISSDISQVFSNLKIGEINSFYVKSLIASGEITNLNNSLLEQIGEFYVNNISSAKSLAQEVLSSLDTHEDMGLWYGSTLLASINSSPIEGAKNIEVERSFISGIKEGGNLSAFSARAYLTKIVPSYYYYLGGYVGDGNISLNLTYEGLLKDMSLEIAISNEFDLYINNNFSGHYDKSSSDMIPAKYNISSYVNKMHNGSNLLELKGNLLYVAGGFVKLGYEGSVAYAGPKKYNLPGINGVINLYDGIYIPQNISSLEIFLHYLAPNRTLFFNLGNKTLINGSNSSEVSRILTDSELRILLNYDSMKDKTIPLRIGLEGINQLYSAGGDAEVILITDVSGSMAEKMSGAGGTAIGRNCSDPQLYTDINTDKISVAKCIDLDFVKTILNGTGNRIGLVSFSQNADSYINLTTNITLLNKTILSYVPLQGTCVACALNRAYLLLNSSSSSRKKFIILMSDGVANLRSSSNCFNAYDISNNLNIFAQAGEKGFISEYNNNWNLLNPVITNNINGMDFFNSTLGFAVGSSGKVIKWNGASWSLFQTVGTSDIYGVDIYNSTLGFAVGSSGKIYRYNGTTWFEIRDLGSMTLTDVQIFSPSLSFVTANNGEIYNWAGGTLFNLNYSNTQDINALSIYNSTLGFAVGSSGKIYRYNGTTWFEIRDLGSMTLTDVQIFSPSLTFVTGDDGKIYNWTGGTAFNASYSGAYGLNAVSILNSTFGFGVGDSKAGVIRWNGVLWTYNGFPTYLYSNNLTTSIDCGDPDLCTTNISLSALNVNYSSCRVHNELGATVHSVGFGPVATCAFGRNVLQWAANCGNGSYYASGSADQLKQIYAGIAQEILNLSYSEQISSVAGNLSTILYPDSYIQINSTSTRENYGIIATSESQFIDNSHGYFYLPSNSQLIEAKVVSYSGSKWTSSVLLNGIPAYGLSDFGSTYLTLGDPYSIRLSNSLAQMGNNIINLSIGVSASNTSQGSIYNKIIYTLGRNASSFSPISAYAGGCIWQIQFENSNTTLKVPSDYTGSENCYYTVAQKEYNANDALQTAVYNLLTSLDYDTNNKVDVEFSNQDLEVSSLTVVGIPYTWSTEVQVRRWY